MKILSDTELPLRERTAVAVGLFDGVHKGHQALIEDITGSGKAGVVYTFDTKPAVSDQLFTEGEKRSILAALGVDFYYSRRFDPAFAALSPADFLEQLVRSFRAERITVGRDFRFGRDAQGDVSFLRDNAERYGYTLHVIPEICLDGDEKISSTGIRAAVRSGDMEKAAREMARFYFIDGRIERGNRIGNTIGFPTANISADKLLPENGVYSTIVKTKEGIYRSVTNVGTKPTIKQNDIVNVETFILDFDRNIYGKEIRVFFVHKQRGEIAFDNLDALRAQIAQDSLDAGELLKDLDIYKFGII